MKSLWNQNRFLRSVSPSFWGNPQPTRTEKRRFVRSVFNSTNHAKRRVRPNRFWTARSTA